MASRYSLVLSPKRVFHRISALFRQPIFWFITIWGHVCIVMGTFGLYWVEHEKNPKIATLLDTFYWSVATVTTVGYGEVSPVTFAGKLIGIFMMVLGSLFLWSYTGLFAGALVAPDLAEIEKDIEAVERELRRDLGQHPRR